MQENGAAPALNARKLVVTEHDDDVVEAILAPQAFGARRIGVLYSAIVISVARGIAPTVVRAQCQDRATGVGSRHAVGAVIDSPDAPAADRRRSVALAFASAPAGAAKRTRQSKESIRNPASRRRKRQSTHAKPASQARSCHRIHLWSPRASRARETISRAGPVLDCRGGQHGKSR